MHVRLPRSFLVKALSHVQSVPDKRAVMPILSHVLLEADQDLRLTVTDLDLTVAETLKAHVVNPGALTVDVHTLYDIARKLPSDSEIVLRQEEDGRLTIECGRSRFQLPTLSATDFSALKVAHLPHPFVLSADACRYLLKQTDFTMPVEDARVFLNGIHFLHQNSFLKTVAIDGHRLALAQIDAPQGNEEMPGVIIPRKTVLEMGRLLEDATDFVTLAFSLTQVSLSFNHVYLQSRLLDAVFPAYEEFIPRNNKNRLITNRKSLIEAIDRVSLLAQESRVIKLEVTDMTLVLSATHPDYGNAVEEISLSHADGLLSTGVNARYLTEILQHLAGEDVEILFEEASELLIQSPGVPNSLYVLMPATV